MDVKAAQEFLKVVKKRDGKTTGMHPQSSKEKDLQYVTKCWDALCYKGANIHNKQNEVFEHSIKPSGTVPASNVPCQNKKEAKKKKYISLRGKKKQKTSHYINEEAECTALHFSGTSHPSILCCSESQTENWQRQNVWEVLLDNQLIPEDLIAAHLEPLTRSSSTSQEDKNHAHKYPI